MNELNNVIYLTYKLGWSGSIYDLAGIMALLVQITFLLAHKKTSTLKTYQVLSVAIICYFGGIYLLGTSLTWIENDFTRWGANNLERVLIYLPLFILALSKPLKYKVDSMLSVYAVSLPLMSAISHAACIFTGCCYGYESAWGVWNPVTNTTMFPVQILDCIVYLCIFIFLMKYKHPLSNRVTYPIFLMMYGLSRYLLDFLRDNEKVFCGISSLALHAAFMVFVGAIWYYILIRKEKKAAAPETT